MDGQPLKKGEATRAAILAAAARRFAERGYADCSLRDVAAMTGLKAASVYHHFASKEVLLDEVLQAGIDRLTRAVLDQLDQLAPEASARTRLRVLIRAHLTSFLDVRNDANTFLRIYEYLPPAMRRRTRSGRLEYARIWFAAFDLGVARGEISPAVERNIFIPFLLQSLNGVIEWFSPSRMTIDGVCEMLDASLLAGVAKPSQGELEVAGR